jgi:hypothetical protein
VNRDHQLHLSMLHAEGLHTAEIARRMGWRFQRVRDAITRLGLKFRDYRATENGSPSRRVGMSRAMKAYWERRRGL